MANSTNEGPTLDDAEENYVLGWKGAAKMVEDIGLPGVAHYWNGLPEWDEDDFATTEYMRGFRDCFEFLLLAAVS